MSATLPALMPNENAVCLCTDRNMLIPALFVANAVKSPNSFDLLVVAGSSEVTDAHRQWMEEHGILLCESIDTRRYDDIEVADKRLSPATLAKLFLARHFAGRYTKILYLDADLTIHDDVSAIFAVETAEFPLAAAPSARIWVGRSISDRTTTEEHFRALGMTQPYRLYESFLEDTPWPKWLDEQRSGRDLRKNLMWEVRRIVRRLRGKSREASKSQLRDHTDAFRRYCAESRFVDVDQGIVIREDGRLQLAGSRRASA